MDVEKQKLEHEETMHNAQKDLPSTIVNLELRQAELTERLKVMKIWIYIPIFKCDIFEIKRNSSNVFSI